MMADWRKAILGKFEDISKMFARFFLRGVQSANRTACAIGGSVPDAVRPASGQPAEFNGLPGQHQPQVVVVDNMTVTV
jgi:hypothetical protein